MRKPGVFILTACAVLSACGGGDSSGDSPAVSPDTQSCSGSCAGANSFLTTDDVQDVIARAVAEAQARNAPATIAVTDRVGNVLAVFAMNGAPTTVTIQSSISPAVDGGLEGVNIVPASLAAIAKAVTGSYLSSEGNAFSTRTASQIIQEHFNPGEALAASGPLSGVQFSQLPCSDLSARFAGGAPDSGPKRSPLGLSADPGGLPLYKGGTPVGAVGVLADGIYTLDQVITDRDTDVDEAIALAATFSRSAPDDRRADRVTVDGKTLRFSDAGLSDLQAPTRSPPAFAVLNGSAGVLMPVNGYFAGNIVAGTPFGQPASGIRPDTLDYPGLDAFVLVDPANLERFRPRAGTEASGGLTDSEVRQILIGGLRTANRARAQIRRPTGSAARVTVSVVDSSGVILGIASTRDAPNFGIDVSLQKARTAAFFSSAQAAAQLTALPDAVYLKGGLTVLRNEPLGQYVTDLRAFTGVPTMLADGAAAFTSRAIGNLERKLFPDGVDGSPPGPLAKPVAEWSVFSTGIQLDLAYNAIVQHVGFVLGVAPDVPTNCTGVSGFDSGFMVSGAVPGLANGFQIFPGSAPVYRNRTLVGAVGVSGDGVDQDDMIAFLGLQDAVNRVGTFSQAPTDIRVDQLAPQGARLRYVSCPQAPFVDSSDAEPCRGL
ncbi:MAG: heme-binding protein [Gammaproteobacteria bacterium]